MSASGWLSNRRRQCLLSIPVQGVNALANRRRVQASNECPLSDSARRAVQRQQSIRSRIVILVNSIGPSAVVRRVWPVVVDAIERMTNRATPHIGKESLVVVVPFRAHGNPARPIGSIAFALRIVASPFRVLPTSIFARCSDCGVAVCSVPTVLARFARQAATGLGVSLAQTACGCDGDDAAIALTKPSRRVPSDTVPNEQSSVAVATEIDNWYSGSHALILIQMGVPR